MLISFEGIDGCGKSTQIALLKEFLIHQGKTVNVFREPGGTSISEQIRSVLLDPDSEIHPVTELLLFSSARSQLMAEKVFPALQRGETVILDRFYDSTTAYQGYGRESVALETIHQINAIASHQRSPDLTFYLQLSLEESARRTAHLKKDRMEQAGNAFFERVKHGFDTLAKSELRFITIDASKSVEQIHRAIIHSL
jgi:dTMP kinase